MPAGRTRLLIGNTLFGVLLVDPAQDGDGDDLRPRLRLPRPARHHRLSRESYLGAAGASSPARWRCSRSARSCLGPVLAGRRDAARLLALAAALRARGRVVRRAGRLSLRRLPQPAERRSLATNLVVMGVLHALPAPVSGGARSRGARAARDLAAAEPGGRSDGRGLDAGARSRRRALLGAARPGRSRSCSPACAGSPGPTVPSPPSGGLRSERRPPGSEALRARSRSMPRRPSSTASWRPRSRPRRR